MDARKRLTKRMQKLLKDAHKEGYQFVEVDGSVFIGSAKAIATHESVVKDKTNDYTEVSGTIQGFGA